MLAQDSIAKFQLQKQENAFCDATGVAAQLIPSNVNICIFMHAQ